MSKKYEIRERLSPTLGDYIESRKYMSPQTVKGYIYTLHRLEKFLAERKKSLTELTLNDLVDYLGQIHENGGSANYIHKQATVIMGFAKWARWEGKLSDREFARIVRCTKQFRATRRTSSVALSEDEIRTIFRKVSDPKQRYILWFALNFGLRSSEMCSMKLQDVDLINRRILVRGRGIRVREIPMTEKQAEVLEGMLDWRKNLHKKCEHLFVNSSGHRLRPSTLESMMRKISKLTGVQVNCRRLRKTFATILRLNGMDFRMILRVLGLREPVEEADLWDMDYEKFSRGYIEFLERMPKEDQYFGI